MRFCVSSCLFTIGKPTTTAAAAAAAVIPLLNAAHPSDAPAEMKCHIEKQIELRDDSKLQPERVAGWGAADAAITEHSVST